MDDNTQENIIAETTGRRPQDFHNELQNDCNSRTPKPMLSPSPKKDKGKSMRCSTKTLIVGIFGFVFVGFTLMQTTLLREASNSSSRTGHNNNNYYHYRSNKTPSFDNNRIQVKLQPPDPFSEEELTRRHLSKNESFAACLMIMDENHRLPEWLAYHYHVLPLRHLVLHQDPRSITNATSAVLQDWMSVLRNDITFDIWTTDDFTTSDAMRNNMKVNMSLSYEKRLTGHRLRQNIFYQQCAKFLHLSGYHWTMFVDVDEYFTLSSEYFQQMKQNIVSQKKQSNVKKNNNTNTTHPPSYYQPYQTWEAQGLMEQPGIVLKVLKDMRSLQKNTFYQATIAHNLLNKRSKQANQSNAYDLNTICMNVPRARYSSIDIDFSEHGKYRSFVTNPQLIRQRMIDGDNHNITILDSINTTTIFRNISQHYDNSMVPSINATKLDTMRFRIRATPRGNRQGPGKSIVDVSLINLRRHKLVRGNAHRVLLDICPKLNKGEPYGPPFELYGHRLPFGIHHYYGTIEAHMYKQDWHGYDYQLYRFRKEALFEKNLTKPANVSLPPEKLRPYRDDDEVCSWLSGFITNVGYKRASYLLRNAQYLPPKKNTTML